MSCFIRRDGQCIKEECRLYDADNWSISRCRWNKIKADAMKLMPIKYFLDEIFKV